MSGDRAEAGARTGRRPSGRASDRGRAAAATAILAASHGRGDLLGNTNSAGRIRLYGSDDGRRRIGAGMKTSSRSRPASPEGLGLGHNALAALITRGLAELTLAYAAPEGVQTLAGLSGLGISC
jgi:glycerol-3-phosphate dehydrogenase (NAD(P)+)